MAMGGGLYLAGNIIVTMLFNVPKNQALARLDPASSEAAAKSAVMNLVFMALFRFFCLLLFGRRQGYSDTFTKRRECQT